MNKSFFSIINNSSDKPLFLQKIARNYSNLSKNERQNDFQINI